ncbi:mannan endo-1,4-beta-mannosidase-like [Eriocheir sinensis]|uniref:mannan endo-1,4-beta-mannosidase-like n=1 Tax=Eriocheir sinensis TaxID=95602 RepID=UPI0021C6DB10|nr:mannan endo-1,4-beta-mannosidase-like [Eriocheir sinensis]
MFARAPALLLLLAALAGCSAAARLDVSGTDLTYNGEKVFLIGANYAWLNYGNDFGNGGYSTTLENWLQEIGASGGNSVRVWVHVEGYSTPAFDSNGYVTACDNTGQFESDIRRFLDVAQENDILVTLAMWNGAYITNQFAIDLIWDDSKLDSYIANCLNSLMNTIKGHPALGAFEAVNEPEGSILVESNSEPCYDTETIGTSGAGWTGKAIPMERYLRFIGRQNAAVRAIDPETLITLGSWGQFPQSDAFYNTRNHYSDHCLTLASGTSNSVLDFYQMHAYAWGDTWSPNAPFTVNAGDYLLDKPIVIGEYASVCAEPGDTLGDLYTYAYEHGYSGGWSWHYTATGDCSDTRETQQQYLSTLSGRTDHGTVDFVVG